MCAALADRDRLRLFGTICREPGGLEPGQLHLDSRDRKALEKLLAAGMVERDGDRYVVRAETFRHAIVHGDGDRRDPALAGASDEVAALFSRGKLVNMPRYGSVLCAELLGYLADRFFARDRAYTEWEVRELLQQVYDDHAALRRYLVDDGLLNRDNYGAYWRPD